MKIQRKKVKKKVAKKFGGLITVIVPLRPQTMRYKNWKYSLAGYNGNLVKHQYTKEFIDK